ncbi:V-type ATP synthase subunit I [Tunicatimonas pelagia]|uniref:V-type ATP synthase subunit I n=1 Tax=Tunicatimonas pelagia TaxID=931531 RepID=UPI002665A915|nr:V-type ATPase 116kDa subunit family protein [Tunicatimonas pelagia]WKN45596.1 V-type ATPase 116kDa subunit family protein [Tunicatimonas pelagia]
MKAKFKKLNLLAHHREREKITSVLQELGVVHLELDSSFVNKTIEELELEKNKVNKALEALRDVADDEQDFPASTTAPEPTADQVIEQLLALKYQRDSIVQESESLRKSRQKLSPWGDFRPENIALLIQSGLSVSFWIATNKEFNQYDFTQLVYQVIHRGPDQTYFVVLSQGEKPSLPFEMIELPTIGLAEVKTRENELGTRREAIAEKVRSYLPYQVLLEKKLTQLNNEWMFQVANGSYQEYGDGAILHLKGWFPATMEKRLLHYLQREKLSYTVANPTADDTVPVLLKNPKYPKLFESITKIFQLPGYYEIDLTPFIAVFYPILFAYCLGDAGYGLILLLAAIIGAFTFLKDARNIAVLGIILGLFTTLMGVVKSGSVFGLPIVGNDSHPILTYLAQYVVIPDDRGVVFNAFNVALLIGVVQILTGIIVSIINRVYYRSLLASLSQIGKLLIVVSLIWIFLADMQGVAALHPFAIERKITLVLGVLLVLFFHNLDLPVLNRVASGILPLFFILTGILGDVLSYVRLFALGVASSVLGLVVNQIGMQIMGDQWWGILLGILFLIAGHSLNFALAALGAFVHPLRLTFVEFYNNAQFEGGGVAYRPLRKN